MGIFSDACQALVDPATGRCLSGERLEQAKQDPKAPRCGHRVKKKARFLQQVRDHAPGRMVAVSAMRQVGGQRVQLLLELQGNAAPRHP